MWFLKCIQKTQRRNVVAGFTIVVLAVLLIGAFRDSKAKSSIMVADVQFMPTERTVNAFERLSTTSTEDMITSKETPSNGSKGAWLDTEKLIQVVFDELKSVGWSGFNNTIAFQIRRLKLPKAFTKKKKETDTIRKTTKKVLSTMPRRWKVVPVGCFYESGPTKALFSATRAVSSVSECVTICSGRNERYASVSAGTLCRCGKSVSTNVFRVFAVPESCNLKCEHQPDRSCGGEQFASVYHIIKKDSLGLLNTETTDRSSVGCFIKPQNLDLFFKVNTFKMNPNSAECLLSCERSYFAIASWERSGVCRCGKFTQKFPLHAMGFKVNNSFCDEKTCNADKNACGMKYVKILRTYNTDERCETRRFFSSETGHLVALASFPGSGNTWTRYLIESATGIYSGSIYGDFVLYRDGFIGEKLPWNSRRTSVIKTHKFVDTDVKIYEEAILVIRNPYDAIIAELNRVRGGHTGYAEPEIFNTMEWIYFVAYNAAKWFSIIEQYTSLENHLIIYFEDMTADPIREVRKMVDFLKYPVPDVEERLACLESNLSGDFKRQKRKLLFDPYLQKSKDIVNLCIKSARKLLDSIDDSPLPHYER